MDCITVLKIFGSFSFAREKTESLGANVCRVLSERWREKREKKKERKEGNERKRVLHLSEG